LVGLSVGQLVGWLVS